MKFRCGVANYALITQPCIYFCLLKPWLSVFAVPALERGFSYLVWILNQLSGWQHYIALSDSSSLADASEFTGVLVDRAILTGAKPPN